MSAFSVRSTVFLIPFSHLDLFWLGTREECLSRGCAVIARALDLLEKYEDFRFLIETVNFLEHYLSCYPAEEERIRRLAESGRLELAPLWAGVYQNLPGGETHARNALYAKRFLRQRFGCDPAVAHFGDLPGYTPQYPQIARLAGITYILLTRGGPARQPLFLWEGLDGTRIPAYAASGYGGLAMGANWHKDFSAMCDGKLECLLQSEMEGKEPPLAFHWGADLCLPHENLVENVRRWNQEKNPEIRFSTFTEFFSAALPGRELSVRAGEVPSAWPNVESSWPDLWPQDIQSEAALQMAEFLCSFCLSRGWQDYPQQELEGAWKMLLDGMDHNQNGQGGERSDQDKLDLKVHARLTAERIIQKMAWRLAAQTLVPREDAFPVVVFNPLSWRRDSVICGRGAVFGVVRSCDINRFLEGGLQLTDAQGNIVPYVPLRRHEGLSITLEFSFRAELPAAGYATWYLTPGRNPGLDGHTCTIRLDEDIDHDLSATWPLSTDRPMQSGPKRAQECNVYEGRFWQLEVDTITGSLTVRNQLDGNIVLAGMRIEGVEERRGSYIADMTASGRTFPALIERIETVDNNSIWCRVRLSGSVYGMPFTQTVTLYHDSADMLIENEIDWSEPRWVRLEQVFPYTGAGQEVSYDTPFGQVAYPQTMPGEMHTNGDEIDAAERGKYRLCNHWVDIGDCEGGMTIGCDHRMWEFEGQTLRSFMVRGAGYCAGVVRTDDGGLENIARPPAGKYRFRYLLRPRTGTLAHSSSYRCGWELNRPPLCVAVGGRGAQSGAEQIGSASLFDLSNTSLVVTAVKKAEEGSATVVRAFEAAGLLVALEELDIPGKRIFESDILEKKREPLRGCRPYEIKTWIVE